MGGRRIFSPVTFTGVMRPLAWVGWGLIVAATGCSTVTGVTGPNRSGSPPGSDSSAPSRPALNIMPAGPMRLLVGQTQRLSVELTDRINTANGIPVVDQWLVSPIGVVTVDSVGQLQALATGTVQIRARIGPSLSDPLLVTVVRVTRVEILPAITSITVQDEGSDPASNEAIEAQLQAKVLLSDGFEDHEVVWISGDPSRIRVDSGKVIAAPGAEPGMVIIRAHSAWDTEQQGTAVINLVAAGRAQVFIQ